MPTTGTRLRASTSHASRRDASSRRCCESGGGLHHSVPDGRTRRLTVFKSLQSATVRKANKNNLAGAAPEFLHSCRNVMKALFDRLAHPFRKLFFRNVSRRWRGSEKRQPDLLNCGLQFSRLGASLNHARATLAIQSTEVRRNSRRDQGIRTIGNRQTFH